MWGYAAIAAFRHSALLLGGLGGCVGAPVPVGTPPLDGIRVVRVCVAVLVVVVVLATLPVLVAAVVAAASGAPVVAAGDGATLAGSGPHSRSL